MMNKALFCSILLLTLSSAIAEKILLVGQELDDNAIPTNNRLMDVALSLKKSGNDVTVMSRDSDAAASFKELMNQEGITFHAGSGADAAALFAREQFDTAFLPLWFWNKQTVPESFQQAIAEVSPKTKIVILTDDAHADRRSQLHDFVNADNQLRARFPALAKDDAKNVATREQIAYQNADVVVSISEHDLTTIQPLSSTPSFVLHFASASTVKPLAAEAVAPMQAREGVVFVGYGANPTNALGLEWFFAEIFPTLSQEMQSVTFNLVGAAPADDFASLRKLAPSARIVAHGMVSEDEMNAIVAGSRVMMAPIPASTGINTKVYVGLCTGTPVVSTSTAAAGLQWSSLDSSAALAIADSPADFAASLTSVYNDAAEWQLLSRSGLSLASAQLASGAFEHDLAAVLAAVSAAPAKSKNFDGYLTVAELSSASFTSRRLLAGSGSDDNEVTDPVLCSEGTVVCQNGGICFDDAELGAQCNCAGTGFNGGLCHLNIDNCPDNQCANGGVCVDGINAYTCDCAGTNHHGDFCSVPDSCSADGSAPANGNAGNCGTANAGSTCDVECNAGYVRSGTYTRTCVAGSWTAQSAVCTPVTCSALTAGSLPSGGALGTCGATGTFGQASGSCVTSCANGYVATSGSGLRTCGTDGQWSAATLTCLPVTCAAITTGAPSGGSLGTCGAAGTYGQASGSCAYSCSAGYTASGSGTRTCGTNGQWSASTLTCTPVTCSAVTAGSLPSGGALGTCGSTGTYGQASGSCAISCAAGYTPSGSGSRTCGTDGQWSAASLTCTPVTCAAITTGAPSGGSLGTCGAAGTYGQASGSCAYSCSAGYTASGSGTRTCGTNGQWSASTLTCTPVTCSAITAGSLSTGSALGTCGSAGTYGQNSGSCAISCANGYVATSGSGDRTCGTNGQWSAASLVCELATCPRDNYVPNGGAIGTCTATGTFGQSSGSCTIQCSAGYTASGSGVRTCQADGTWSTPSLTCTGVTCAASSTAPSNGAKGTCGSSGQFGSASGTCLNTCNLGYAPTTGSLTRTCQANGQWTAVASCTAAATCAAPSTSQYPVNGGRGTCTTQGQFMQAANGQCTMTCNNGFELTAGSLTRTCQANGQWTAIAATCSAINECASNPCQNGAQCIDGVASYTCRCPTGFAGVNCEENINDCTVNACGVNGECVDGANTYTCACYNGYSGAKCETNINDCLPDPCNGHGTCTDGLAAYSCSCSVGWTGTNCQTNPDNCIGVSCGAGQCVDGLNTYTCNCPTGFTGAGCATNIDDCSPNPCGVGSCTDLVNGYTCSCPAGYSGDNCQTTTCPTSGQLVKTTTATGEHDAVDIEGTVKVVGYPALSKGSVALAGGVYIFVNTAGTTWSAASSPLLQGTESTAQGFGRDVALSGNYLAVSAPQATSGSASKAGVVYVYTRSGSGLSTTYSNRLQTVTQSDAVSNRQCGNAIAFADPYLVVACSADSSNRGAVYVYYNSGAASNPFGSQAKLTHPSASSNDYFGYDVAVSGTTLAVGARGDNSNAGSVVVFKISSGTNTWGAGVVLTPSTAGSNSYFGSAVALNGDLLVVGQPESTTSGVKSGAAYVFTRSSQSGSFSETAKLLPSGAAANDLFGFSVAIQSQSLIAIGVPQEDGVGKTDQGAVEVYCKGSGSWSRLQVITANDNTANHKLGRGLAYSGSYLAVTAVGTGAYIFMQDGDQCFNAAALAQGQNPNPCKRGTCNDGFNSYTCTCDAGFSGPTCATNIDECASRPCAHGTCYDGDNSYTCACENGWQGAQCDSLIPVNCHWIGPANGGTDDWCQINCNRNYPYCPAELCSCDGALPTHGDVGCADGTREGFKDRNNFQNIAACAGGWSIPGIQANMDLVPRCDRKAGNDGTALVGCSAADVCEQGWHVCASPIDVAVSVGSNLGCKAASDFPPTSFFATRTSGNGAGNCNMDGEWANDLFGCGTDGADIFPAATGCTGLTKFSHNACSAMTSGTGWSCADSTGGWNEANELTHSNKNFGGVMCCKNDEKAKQDDILIVGPLCEASTARLACPLGTTVNMLSASYGRTDKNVCTLQAGIGAQSQTGCVSTTTPLTKMIAACKGKQTCDVVVNKANLNNGVDPCSSSTEYFQAKYNCINPDGSTATPPVQTAQPTITSSISAPTASITTPNKFGPVCEGGVTNLYCPTGYVIAVNTAFYGRSELGICPSSGINDLTCSKTDALAMVSSACNGLQQCQIGASSAMFGDLCSGTRKYMTGTYSCQVNENSNWRMAVCSKPGTAQQMQLYIDPSTLSTYLEQGAFVGTCSSKRLVTVTLDVDFDSIPSIEVFLATVLADLYRAAGVDPSVGVFFVSSWASGSMVLEIAVYPSAYDNDPLAPTDPSVLVAKLQAQMADPDSVYNQGTYTSKTTSIVVAPVEGDSSSSGNNSSSDDTKILGLTIGLPIAGAIILVAVAALVIKCLNKKSAKVVDSFDATVPGQSQTHKIPAAAPAPVQGDVEAQPLNSPAGAQQGRMWTLDRQQQ